jgi:hypothetical protein
MTQTAKEQFEASECREKEIDAELSENQAKSAEAGDDIREKRKPRHDIASLYAIRASLESEKSKLLAARPALAEKVKDEEIARLESEKAQLEAKRDEAYAEVQRFSRNGPEFAKLMRGHVELDRKHQVWLSDFHRFESAAAQRDFQIKRLRGQ